MQLLRLECADILRDGGSYEAFFTTDEDLGYCICLPHCGWSDMTGAHYKYLYAFRSEAPVWLAIPEDVLPIVTGSDEEQQLIEILKALLDEAQANRTSVERLPDMLNHIRKREPCFPYDPIFRRPSQR